MAAYETAGKSDDWMTPAYIFKALGIEFDMDVSGHPASCVPARHVIMPPEDGLAAAWHGCVWMNPPFGHQRHKIQWLRKFIIHGNGIALLPDRTSAPWFQELAPLADMICFVAPKIKFLRPDGTTGNSPGSGTALMACGQVCCKALARSGLGMCVTSIHDI